MHIDPLTIDVDKAVEAGPVGLPRRVPSYLWLLVCVGLCVFGFGLIYSPHNLVWMAFYTNLVFFMGLSIGCVMITIIFQIVRAHWSPPVRRIAEANIAFLPIAWLLLLCTYFGKEHLFYWGHSPMPGREWWMQPDFVYARFAILLGLLFFILYRFVRISIRADIGLAREKGADNAKWQGLAYDDLIGDWKGSTAELAIADKKRSFRAPIMVAIYAVIYSLFAFEMIMGMDKTFYANMFGGFVFIGNIYAGWAVLSLLVMYFCRISKTYKSMVGGQQLHDLGKMTFSFGVLWAYLFFAHFLPIWYGNLPEETQWIIVRMRENPWRILSWLTLSACFVTPFICLLSRDIKKTPAAFSAICLVILCGLWCERYILIAPQISPHSIPFGILEIGTFIGFLGAYLICVNSFLARFPIVPVSDLMIEEAAREH